MYLMLGNYSDVELLSKEEFLSFEEDIHFIEWIYKNYEKIGNPEYIGFNTSERTFCFEQLDINIPKDIWGTYIHANTMQADFPTHKVQQVIQQYDVLVPNPFDLQNIPYSELGIYNHSNISPFPIKKITDLHSTIVSFKETDSQLFHDKLLEYCSTYDNFNDVTQYINQTNTCTCLICLS